MSSVTGIQLIVQPRTGAPCSEPGSHHRANQFVHDTHNRRDDPQVRLSPAKPDSSIAFAGAGKEVGAHNEYGRCVLGLFLAYLIQSVDLQGGDEPPLTLSAGCALTMTLLGRSCMHSGGTASLRYGQTEHDLPLTL